MKKMDYRLGFHRAYLRQQGLEVTPENIKECSFHPERLVLLDETDEYWVIKLLDVLNVEYELEGECLNIVYKDTFDMRGIRI